MKIEDRRYQRYRKHQASNDAPSELVPDRIERDLLAEPLVLGIAAVEIVGEDRHKGANYQLKHGRPPPSPRCSPRSLQGRAELTREPDWFPAPLQNRYPAWYLQSSRPTLRCCATVCRNRGYRSWQAAAPLPRTGGCA